VTQTFTIRGRLPSLNEYINAERTNRYKAAKLKKDLQERIGAEIRAANLKQVKVPVKLTYRFYEANRRRDKDNIAAVAHKVVQDSLVSEKILEDDGWGYVIGFEDEFYLDKKNPRIEVDLCPRR
jgi:hypothetical protein